MAAILIYSGSAVIIAWGIAHLIPTRAVVRGFEPLSKDNRRIIIMEWAAEGLTLLFIGGLVITLTVLEGAHSGGSKIGCRASTVMLLVMALLSSLTGARTSILPLKICPFVKSAVAFLFLAGSIL